MNSELLSSIIVSLHNKDVDICVKAAAQLHKESGAEDIPSLLELLQSEDFFVREAAAWPLVELSGSKFLSELFAAYQRGFDEGHDNDGFTTALLEIPALYPSEARQALEHVVSTKLEPMRSHASWLLEFCAA